VYFLEGRGLTSFCIVYDIASSRHMELWSVYVLLIQFIYISIRYTYISVQYIYLFIMQWESQRLTSIVLDMVHPCRTVLLHKHTVPVSECWHFMLSKHISSKYQPLHLRIIKSLLFNTICYSNMFQPLQVICNVTWYILHTKLNFTTGDSFCWPMMLECISYTPWTWPFKVWNMLELQ
jgi:hypothetical protein